MKSSSTYTLLTTDVRPKYLPIFYDTRDPDNFEAGLLNRINLKPLFTQTDMTYVNRAIDHVFDKIGFERIATFSRADHESYLNSRPYPLYRRKQLLKVFSMIDEYHFNKFEFPTHVQTFIKDETYSKLKPPRLICARNDTAKTMLGPYFHYIDDKLFNSIYSVKHVPYMDRPKVITERFAPLKCQRYLVLDYTSFECSAGRESQNAIEYQYYRRIFPNHIYESIHRRLLAKYTPLVAYDMGKAKISTVRFSGEMNTSCGNTLYNLTAIISAGMEQGFILQPLVEGDDSLTPLPEGFNLPRFLAYLSTLGLIVKHEVHDYHGDCGYCSSYWDESGAQPTMDLKDFLLNIQICASSTVQELGHSLAWQSKILSYAIQYPHTPIVMDFAKQCNNYHLAVKFNSYYYDELSALSDVSLRHNYIHSDPPVSDTYTQRDVVKFCVANGLSLGMFYRARELIQNQQYQQAINYLLDRLDVDPVLRTNCIDSVARATRNVPSYKKKSFFSPCSPCKSY